MTKPHPLKDFRRELVNIAVVLITALAWLTPPILAIYFLAD